MSCYLCKPFVLKDKQEMLGLLKKQHESEKNDVTHHLKLEQDEQSEKLRRVRIVMME